MQNATLHPAQAKIALDTHRFRVVNCGRRFGKTILACWEMFGLAVSKKDVRIAYIAPTYQQARDIAWGELKKITKDVQSAPPNESRLEVKVKTSEGGESLITLRGWESIETLRGQLYDFVVLDEVSSYRNFWEQWQEVVRPTLTDRKGEALFISTPKGFNHFYDLYNLQNKDTDYKSFHFSTYDNPFVPREEVDKAKLELTEDRFAQEYMADFRKTEGLVYKEFSRDRHVLQRLPLYDRVKRIAGIDFGYTNPAAILTIDKDTDNRYFVTDEWYKRGQTDAQIADYAASLQFNEVYPDPASASGNAELRNRGVNVREVIKNNDSIRNGISLVREMFKANRLFISATCVNLISELETYAYPDKKPDRNDEENPIKENDHALDALRYALMMDGGVGQSNITVSLPDY